MALGELVIRRRPSACANGGKLDGWPRIDGGMLDGGAGNDGGKVGGGLKRSKTGIGQCTRQIRLPREISAHDIPLARKINPDRLSNTCGGIG